MFNIPNINSRRMAMKLKTSVITYLEKYGTVEKNSLENTLLAMTNHYKDLHVVEFYSKYFPREKFYLTKDEFYININNHFGFPIKHNGKHDKKTSINYKRVSLSRKFSFEEILDETIEINFHLYFEEEKDIIDKFNIYVDLKKKDLVLNEYVNDESLFEVIESEWYQKNKSKIPFMSDLFINYNL